MNAYKAHLLNALTLMIMGAWGYYSTNAPTSLIPVFLGVVLLSFSQGVKNENKALAHVAVIVTLLGLIAIVVKPLMVALNCVCFKSFTLILPEELVLDRL